MEQKEKCNLIEDLLPLYIEELVSEKTKNDLLKMARANDERVLNTTVIMHNLIIDICENSSPEKGICLSPKFSDQIDAIKDFNYKHIYQSDRLQPSNEYFKMVINQIFNLLKTTYNGINTTQKLNDLQKIYPKLIESFKDWIASYWNLVRKENSQNDIIFDMENEKDYYKAIIYYISGMTDNFAIEIYNEIIGF